jgi:oligoendopeptidase F
VRRTEPWVFATYRVGGFDNLVELLHETGHAVHIAAIDTRPAFLDWPDNDSFSEALGDLLALEAYEPAWQRRYLEAEVPLADSLRGKYGWIVFDVVWALLEMRLHRDPSLDPNQVWTELTHEYLRIAPHPELSWWAMRGQLINAPGYMANYAIGAVLVADLRARARELRGPFAGAGAADAAGASWYPWLAERLYRFGLERTSRQVIEDFLGRPVSPHALLEDLARIGATSR